MQLVKFDSLAGVPTHYDRYAASSGYGYGTRGRPASFRADSTFHKELDRCVDEIKARSPQAFGSLQVIASAGAYVSKPGFHGQGRAFDLDALFWEKRSLITKDFPNDPFLYVAIESVLRKHFGTVLNYDYNVDHQDHFHIDNGSGVSFQKMSKSRVTFLQHTLHLTFGIGLPADGVFGPITEAGLKMALEDAKLPNISTKTGWLAYLDYCATHLFLLA